MVDTLSKDHRSWLMGRVRQRNTKPEITVRSIAHALGYRFRLHREDLPGKPDIVFPRHRKVIFVHGCFWHRHDCKKATTPSTNVEFWQEKFDRNVERDQRALDNLSEMGWNSMVIWECETKSAVEIAEKVTAFLGGE